MTTLNSSYQTLAETEVYSDQYGKAYLKLQAKCNSQNAENLTSSVSYRTVLTVTGNGNYLWVNDHSSAKSLSGTGAQSVSVTNNGSEWRFNQGDTVVQEITGTVSHNADDGTASVSTTGKLKLSAYFNVDKTLTASADLPTLDAGGLFRVKVANEWKKARPYVRQNGAWKKAKAYVRNGSSWKKGK